MAARFIAEEGDLKGLILSLEGQEQWIIGRDAEECQLVISDPLVSRKHAIAYAKTEGIYIENLSETNPLQVNDEEIGTMPYLLHHGDTVKFGNELFRYYIDSEAHVLDEEYPATVNSVPEQQEEALPITGDESLIPEQPLTAPIPEKNEEIEEIMDKTYDTILKDNDEEFAPLAEIDFGLADVGRWLLKVVNGPNNGAEFYMQAGNNYILGTDPKSCDIVFHDTSVSRQHAKITVSPDDVLSIEDMNSRNGVLLAGTQIGHQEPLEPGALVTIGTTSFIVYDREGEMQTIISPLLPSIVKILQEEDKSAETDPSEVEPYAPVTPPPEPATFTTATPPPAAAPSNKFSKFILIGSIIGLFTILGIGTSSLFKSEPVQTQTQENAEELIQQTLAPYPAIKWSYNKATQGLFLLGHVSTAAEKNQLLYTLNSMPFIKNIDDTGIVIDEGVWREINSILASRPAWSGISIHSPEAGQFVLTGNLKTRKEAEQLYDYISMHFPYLDLLKREVVVEEEVLGQIKGWLNASGMTGVVPQMNNGEISLTGNIPTNLAPELPSILNKIKSVPGVRMVNNFIQTKTPDMGIQNISNKYQVTGSTKVGDKYTVQINGRILSEGDRLDNMTITSITPNTVFLEEGNKKYRIDYKT